jgi:hypothetical protein
MHRLVVSERFSRRAALSCLTVLPVVFATRTAFAGSYLDRASLLLSGSRKDAEALRDKMTDKELARVVRTLAEARLEAASKMDIPPAIAKAHPHLLLTFSKVERAAKAAIDGHYPTVLEQLESSKREEAIFRSLLKELGYALPKEHT